MNETPKQAIEYIAETYSQAAAQMTRKVAEHAWLEGWIACLQAIRRDPVTMPIENPYTEE